MRAFSSRIRDAFAAKLGIGAGVVDAAMSSLATFLAGLVAANVLSDAELGVYAVFFTAFNFGQVIANNLVYVPAEVVTVAWPERARTGVLRQSIPLAFLPSLGGAVVIGIAALVGARLAGSETVLPLAMTATGATLLWPTQDHVRRLLHIANRSWAAASVSIVQFAITGAAIIVLVRADVAAAWIPFGALALANLISLSVGLLLAVPGAEKAPERLRRRELIRSGTWLTLGVGASPITAFGVATIISFAAGPEVLGYAEAARIVAHPIVVLGTGLSFVLGPRIMKAAIEHDAAASRRKHVRFNSSLVVVAVTYAAFVGFDWMGNPMARLVPVAYVVEWLVIATVLADALYVAVALLVQELTAAQRTRTVALVSLASAPLQLAAATTAGVTQAFSRPLSLAVGSGLRLAGYRHAVTGFYAPSAQSDDSHAGP